MQLVLRYTTSYMCPRTAPQVSPSSVRQGVYWAAYSEYLYQCYEYGVLRTGIGYSRTSRAQNTPVSTQSLYGVRKPHTA